MFARLALLASLCAGCGGPSAPLAAPPSPAIATASAPKPVARWSLGRSSGFQAGRALKLGAVSLIPGRGGERWIVRENRSITNAPTILEADLVAALRSGDGVDLVTSTADILTTATLDGDVVATRRPAQTFVHAAADHVAILALDAQGAMMRSTDRGKSWNDLDLARFGRATDVAMDGNGRALALVIPEGLIGSSDHGLSWKRLRSPVESAERVSIADDGLVYVGSFAAGARWDGASFRAPEKVEEPERWIDEPIAAPIVASAMGSRALLDVALVDEKLRYAVTPLGSARRWRTIDARCARVEAAAHEEIFSIGCAQVGGLTRDFLSLDGGATFVEGAPRSSHTSATAVRTVLGPKGAALVPSEKGSFAVRPSSDAPLREMELAVRLLAATVDEKRGRFVLLVVDDDHHARFATLAFDEVKPKLLAGLAPIADIAETEPTAMAVDGDAIVATIARPAEIVIFRSKDGGTTVETSALGFPRATVSVAGSRGLFASDGRLYETYDFATKYRDAGRPRGGPLACGAAGCGAGFAMRLGWDHPHRPESYDGPKFIDEPPTAKTAPRDLDCTVGAKIGPTVGTFDDRAYDGDVGLRWFGEHAVVEGTEDKPATKVTTLLPKGSHKEQIVFHALPNGVVAVRYSIPPKGSVPGLRPVSMEIAWRRNGDTKVRKAKLGEVGSFRIAVGNTALAERRWSWIVGIVDDGVLVQPTPPKYFHPSVGMAPPYTEKDPIRYVHDDGKIERLEAPEPIPIARVVMKTANGWMIAAREPNDDGTVSVETSSDGKGWKHRPIRLWTPAPKDAEGFWYADEGMYERTVGFGFSIIAGAPVWSIAPSDGPYAYVAELTAAGLEVASAKISDDPCGDEPGALRVPYPVAGGFRYGGALLRRGVLRISRKSGTACMRAIGGNDTEGYPVVISLDHHAWLAKHDLRAMTCTLR